MLKKECLNPRFTDDNLRDLRLSLCLSYCLNTMNPREGQTGKIYHDILEV